MKYLPKPDEYDKYWYIDTEADSLTPTRLWMMCASRMDQEEVHSFVGHEAIKSFFDNLDGSEVYFVGHNSISFDGPVIHRLIGVPVDSSNTIDTLVLSYLYNPSLPGGHSLGAWGERLNDPKGHFNDFSKYSKEMDDYCVQDVKLGKKVFKGLVTRMLRLGFSELSCQIEHEIREVIDEQQNNGWAFDIPGAQSLVGVLRAEQAGLEGPIRELFPPRLEPVKTYERRFKKDNSDFGSYLRHLEEYPSIKDNEDGTYTTYDWREFNIGSPQQRVTRLLELGYVPQAFTPKTEKGGGGNPKVDEESLLVFAEQSGRPEVKAIAEWLVLQGRATMVEGWLNNVDYDDSCMHGKLLTCGAATRRMIHFNPNSANIPKAKPKVKYGKECRSLWRARPGRVELGCDAAGLEMRMLAEYLNNEEARTLFTTGDPHMLNTRNLGLPDEMRDITVKNGFYCWAYGGGDIKLGRTLKPELVNENEARKYGKYARSVLEKGIPGMEQLINSIQSEFKRNGGLLRTFDGGFVRCNSMPAALNYKLQSAGELVMKVATILARKWVREKQIDALLIGKIHDELQWDVHPDYVEQLGKLCVEAIEEAGRVLGFVTPLTGSWKSGPNWASCH